jgi:hypothetical protein
VRRNVPGGLGHGHPPVEGDRGGEGPDHEYDAPGEVGGLRRVERGAPARAAVEGGGDGHGGRGAGEDPEPLHGEDGGDEGAPGAAVGELGHDGGGERVVPADGDAEEEAEEAEAGERAPARAAHGEAAADGGADHEEEGRAVDAAPARAVAQRAEGEVPRHGAQQRDADGGGHHGGRRHPGAAAAVRGLVVDAADELHDGRDAEEIVRVGEEAHAGDDDGLEVVVLRPRLVQRRQHPDRWHGVADRRGLRSSSSSSS